MTDAESSWGASERFTLRAPADLARFIAPKGSVALNGTSLTVNEVEGRRFGVNIIPHTRTHTTFRTLKPGDKVNFEVDMLARYVARQLGVELGRDHGELGTGIQQQARLALRHLAAADQQHGFVVESAKDGQVVHGAS